RYDVRTKVTGLTEYLCGEYTLNDIIYMTSEKNMEIIFTGAVAPNPSELFSGERFKALLKAVREQYDYVILDTAPVNAVIDGVLIARECDGTVMVVESGATDRTQIQHARQQLKYAGVKLLGVVLNKVGSRKSGYGYGYGYGYGRGYGYGYGYGHDYGYGEDSESDGKKKNRR
ncbi:MAG: CpsD/CapB family tyrosine-protein kinase, partial [bacterium]